MAAAFAWGAGVLYWHLRIRSALRTLRQTDRPEPRSSADRARQDQATEALAAAGCRALPYLVDALEETEDPAHLMNLSALIVWASVFPGGPVRNVNSPLARRRLHLWAVESPDSPEERRRKLDRIRAWWMEHGSEYHQAWRFWSGQCRPYRPEEDR